MSYQQQSQMEVNYDQSSYIPHDPSGSIVTYSMQGAVNQTYETINNFTNAQNNYRHAEEMKNVQNGFRIREETYKKQIEVLKSTIGSLHTAQQNYGPTQHSELQTLYQELSSNPVGKLPPQIIETQQALTKRMIDIETQLSDVVAKNASIQNLNQTLFQVISKMYNTLNDASYINQPRSLEEATRVITELNSELERDINEVGATFSPVLTN